MGVQLYPHEEGNNFESDIELRPEQEGAIEKTLDKDFGVIVSPPGSGKTVIGLELIAQKK